MENKETINSVLKIIILLLLLVWCFLIIQPFLLVVLWAVILAVAMFPVYNRIVQKVGDSKKKFTTVIYTLVAASLILVPAYFITSSVAETTIETAKQIRSNSLQIPAPSEQVKDWPLIGEKLYNNWSEASSDIKNYSIVHKDFILKQGTSLLSGFKGFIGALVTFVISFIVAVVFMYYSEKSYNVVSAFMNKLIGKDGAEIITMSRDTIRSVVKGILLVAIIQSGLAFIGFKMIGLPAAGVFSFLVLVVAIVQIPAMLVMIPAIILAFSISDTVPAVIFTIYCVLVGLSDNILKPVLMGKGLKTPIIIILIGTIGGMLLHGIIGLFLGAVVLAVMHRLYLHWIHAPDKSV
jgi:predicted PurR-regulated permease PerM